MSVRFGEFVFDAERRELRRDEKPVHLTPKAYELLALLIEQRPKAVSKQTLFERLWPDSFVSEANLASLVFEVRAAVGDRARSPRHVRTLRGYGYAFSSDAEGVQADEPLPRAERDSCRLVWGNREIVLAEGENLLGRTRDTVVWIDSPTVSRRHARIIVDGSDAVIEDLGSKNGTFLHGARLASATPLAHRDEIRLGSVHMTFLVLSEGGSTETAG